MSVRDLPDYTRQVVIRYEGGFIGLEELAARLSSIVPYDLRGNIVLMEDFESELTEWQDGSDGVGSTATRSSERKYSGDWSLKLDKANVGSIANRQRQFHYPGLCKYAMFVRSAWGNNCRRIFFAIWLYTGSKEFFIEVDYDHTTDIISLLTTGNTYHNVGTFTTYNPTTEIWRPILFTFNLETGYYDKLYFADVEYDVSDVPLYYEEAGEPSVGFLSVGGIGAGEGTGFITYVDDIIIAKNVP